jgi:hypothetical protein
MTMLSNIPPVFPIRKQPGCSGAIPGTRKDGKRVFSDTSDLERLAIAIQSKRRMSYLDASNRGWSNDADAFLHGHFV